MDDQTTATSQSKETTGDTSSMGDNEMVTMSETTAEVKDTMTEATVGKQTEDQEGATTERDTDLEERDTDFLEDKVILSDTTIAKDDAGSEELKGDAEGEKGEAAAAGEEGDAEAVKKAEKRKRASETERVSTRVNKSM